MQKYSQESFFRITYVEPKHQSDSHYQAGANDFHHLIWIFWVCRLFPEWYNVDCSQLMSWFDHYQLQLVYPTVEHCPARNLQHKTLQTTFDTFSQSLHLLHILHKSFVCLFSSCIFAFFEIIKHNMPKMLLFSSIFSIKMTTQKFINFGNFFKKRLLIWQLSQYNLTKLFWMKLKVTKCY